LVEWAVGPIRRLLLKPKSR